MKFLLTFLIFLNYSLAEAETQVYFSPSRDCINVLIKEIESASNSIKIAIYDFTNKEIADALIKAKQRGVSILISTEHSNKHDSAIPNLTRNKIEVRFTGERKQHNKYAIFDSKKVFTGSANWTYSAFKKNFENCILIDEKKPVEGFIKNFENIWNK